MKWFVLAVAAGLLAAVGMARAEEKKDAAKALQGTWVVSAVQSNDSGDEEQMKGAKLTLGAEGKASFAAKGQEEHKGTYKVDTAKKPWTIDIMPEGLPGTMKGICQLDGDTLKIAMGDPDSDRPASFKIEKESKFKAMTLKREKR